MTGYRAYRSHQVSGAGPLGLVILTYDSLVTSLSRVKAASEAGDFAEEGQFIARALEAIVGLATSLNMEEGGEIAKNLSRLYAYMSRRLLDGQAKDTVAAAEEVMQLAITLREGWQGIEDQQVHQSRSAAVG